MLSVAIITFNEEENIERTMRSADGIAGEFVIVDSGSKDRTLEIARQFGPKVRAFSEEWKGFTRQKNSSIAKCSGQWVLSLDADEELSAALRTEISSLMAATPGEMGDARPKVVASVPRKNLFLGRWIRHGGGWPDRKYRLFERGAAQFGERAVHEDIKVDPADQSLRVVELQGALIHHAYPTLTIFIEHMNRYSSLGADILVAKRTRGFSFFSIVVQPAVRFVYNYALRGGFLDGREGLLFHLYHSVYMSWKYAKAWERSRRLRS
ncbi:MAG TPA: glycosyltransferase family 2 protein [Terriglobales bacterium]|nr:glycosyltransferase family 2 protein [Terriglobales bacterium]